jgi:hypothetical protein
MDMWNKRNSWMPDTKTGYDNRVRRIKDEKNNIAKTNSYF